MLNSKVIQTIKIDTHFGPIENLYWRTTEEYLRAPSYRNIRRR